MNNIFNSPITTNKSVVERIIDEITNAIINGSLKPGDKLPTEMELCESLQVGRNSVREAIKILEAFGVVYIKRSEGTFISSSFNKLPTEMELCESLQVGRNSVREAIKILEAFGVVYIKRSEGTFISSSFNKKMLDSMLYGLILQKESSYDIVELRKVLDIGVLYAAFSKMTPEKLQKIEEVFKKMEEAVEQNKDMDVLLDYDLEFHRVITESANNPLLTNVYE